MDKQQLLSEENGYLAEEIAKKSKFIGKLEIYNRFTNLYNLAIESELNPTQFCKLFQNELDFVCEDLEEEYNKYKK